MSEYTSGSWFFLGSLVTDDTVIVSDKGEEVLGVSEWVRAEDADLRLMASAPDLLEAAQALLNALDEHGAGSFGEPHANLEMAVSKAKGEQ